MKSKKPIFLAGILLLFVAIAVIAFLLTLNPDTTLEFKLVDKNSGSWVWDATVTIQNRIIRSYYQSDKGAIPLLFSGLEPGAAELKVSAPYYEDVMIPITIKRGENILKTPIEMEGYEIPDFQRFFIFPRQDGNDLFIEFRPANSENRAIKNHPAVNLWIGCKIYIQVKDGVYVSEETQYGSETGELLFKGVLPWEWDDSPDNIYRYSARVSGSRIKKHISPFRVHQYLIVIPDYRQMSFEEINKEIGPLLDFEDVNVIKKTLEEYKQKGKFNYFFTELWNVPALK